MLSSRRSGFTLIELLLVLGIIAILIAIVIVAVNPVHDSGVDKRDAQRSSDVATILNAVFDYAVDHRGNLPQSIPLKRTEICGTEGQDCKGMVDLGILKGQYLLSIPHDPNVPVTSSGTQYFISQDVNARVTVDAPRAERETVTVSQ